MSGCSCPNTLVIVSLTCTPNSSASFQRPWCRYVSNIYIRITYPSLEFSRLRSQDQLLPPPSQKIPQSQPIWFSSSAFFIQCTYICTPTSVHLHLYTYIPTVTTISKMSSYPAPDCATLGSSKRSVITLKSHTPPWARFFSIIVLI